MTDTPQKEPAPQGETPETDAYVESIKPLRPEANEWPSIQLARKLERELATAREEIKQLKDALAYANTRNQEEIDADRAMTRALAIAELDERRAQQNVPAPVRLALMILLRHIEPGWENSSAVVSAWLSAAPNKQEKKP